MRTEASCPPEHRYLMLAARLSSRRFDECRERAIEWCTENPTRLDASNLEALQLLRTIELGDDSAAFLTYSCYADIPKRRVYTAMFDSSRSGEVLETSATLILSVFWRCLPMLGLEHGHHQPVVFKFAGGLPSLVDSLPVCDSAMVDTAARWLGLCAAENWKTISEYRTNA
jgi:hypothetical protein